jgi:hypothetical protein
MNLFTPLDKKYCNYFYYMSVISFVIFFILFVVGIMALVGSLIKKKLFSLDMLNIVMHSSSLIISTFLAYLVNRIMYSMCIKSL